MPFGSWRWKMVNPYAVLFVGGYATMMIPIKLSSNLIIKKKIIKTTHNQKADNRQSLLITFVVFVVAVVVRY